MKKGDVVRTCAQVGKEFADPFSGLAVLFKLPLRTNYPAFLSFAAPTESRNWHDLPVQWIKGRLVIESVYLARSSIHEEEDDAPGFGRKVWRLGRKGVRQALCCGRRRGFCSKEFVQSEEPSQSQARKPSPCFPKEF